jgi:hypothetical protein
MASEAKDYRKFVQAPTNPDDPLAPGQDMYITLRDAAHGSKPNTHYTVVSVNSYGMLVRVWNVDFGYLERPMRAYDAGMAFLPWHSIALIEPVTFARLEDS